MSLKECCDECGFPVDIERKIVVMDNDPFSISEVLENTCDSCGHQKGGWTIPVVYNSLNRMRKHWKNKQNLHVQQLKKRFENNITVISKRQFLDAIEEGFE